MWADCSCCKVSAQNTQNIRSQLVFDAEVLKVEDVREETMMTIKLTALFVWVHVIISQHYATGRRLAERQDETLQFDESVRMRDDGPRDGKTTPVGGGSKTGKLIYGLRRNLGWYDGPYKVTEPVYHTHYSHTSKSCGISSKKTSSTCSPSSSPSGMPTSSPSPSSNPTASSNPSSAPTTSMVPTTSAQPSESLAPTDTPTGSPSTPPSTMEPSSVPTTSPSGFPTRNPSSSPTTSSPSATPSKSPTRSPSGEPSSRPSASPSVSPSLSTIPTELIFETDQRTNGVVDSTCVDEPPTEMGSTRPQILAYKYNLYLTEEGNPSQIARSLEYQLQFSLMNEFLQCEFDDIDSKIFEVVSISSQPFDTVNSGSACDTSNDPEPPLDGTLCVEVLGGIHLSVFFPSSNDNTNKRERNRRQHRRAQTTNASPEVLDAFGKFLTSTMDGGDLTAEHVVQVTFQGFINEEQVIISGPKVETGAGVFVGNPTDTTNVDKLQAGDGTLNSTGSTSGKFGVGSVAIAGTCLLLIAILSVRKRHRRPDLYDKHLDECGSQISSLRDDQKSEIGAPANTIPLSDSDGMVRIHVVTGGASNDSTHEDDSVYIEGDSGSHNHERTEVDDHRSMTPKIETELSYNHRQHHDVRLCTSSTCPICRDRSLEPTFIPVNRQNSRIGENVQEGLGPKRFKPNPDRIFGIPDTVKL